MAAFFAINLPIIIFFLVGVVFMVLEVFTPGFGVPGVLGILCELVAIVITYMTHGGIAALGMTVVVLAVIAIVISLLLKSASSGRLSRSGIILNHEEKPEEGYVSNKDAQVFLGKEGYTKTVLRPTGIAEFEGIRLDVVTEGEFIEANTLVKIEKTEGARIVVQAVDEKEQA